MAKTAKDYPVKYPFGYSSGYGGFHTGEDRSTPWGTPCVLNKTKIANTGNTGYVLPKPTTSNPTAGSHIHVSRYDRAGRLVNPKGSGFSFYGGVPGARPKVIEVGQNSRNGKFVRVRNWSGSATFVYCHLSKITCKVGDRIL